MALLALGLTQREAQVAARLATGATNRQIGDDLGITVGTVKKHLQRVFAALRVETRAAAATQVVRLLE
jgi:DNA-binding CsgD family transcriptional regulator